MIFFLFIANTLIMIKISIEDNKITLENGEIEFTQHAKNLLVQHGEKMDKNMNFCRHFQCDLEYIAWRLRENTREYATNS